MSGEVEFEPRPFRRLPFRRLPFRRLGDYEWPVMPTEKRLTRIWNQLRRRIDGHEEAPYVSDDRLERATMDRLHDVVAPPACEPLIRELSITLDGWLGETNASVRTKLIVLPPCDENDLIASWAKKEGLQIVPPPSRESLTGDEAPGAPGVFAENGEDILVIPRLENWFVRHRRGLGTVRALLAAISLSDRKIVIGCNSWAWAYLSKAVDADIGLPQAFTFQAFDADRLQDWFAELAKQEGEAHITFRTTATGNDVLARKAADGDEDGSIIDDTLRNLAATSLGIPWVAWNLWRRSLRSTLAGEEDGEVADDLDDRCADDEQTIFVTGIQEFTLPERHERAALLLLQALLVHGPMTPAELTLVLPEQAGSNIMTPLIQTGILRKDEDGRLVCRPAAYPTIRAGLDKLGFSMDRL